MDEPPVNPWETNARQGPAWTELPWPLLQRRLLLSAQWHLAIVRLGTIVLLYLVHLGLYLSQPTDAAARLFHHRVSWIAAAWFILAVGILAAIVVRQLRPLTLYAMTVTDISLLTALAALGSGSASPLTWGYFVLLLFAISTFDARLVGWTGFVNVLAFYFLVGVHDPIWFDIDHQTPVFNQATFVVSMLAAVLTGRAAIGTVERLVQGLQRREGANA